ncbi:MAG: Ig-like domain-containing protein [Christensenellaceae bacterium]|nr:Ig-like domain-containing protein [Christensenellaceae bacterium]
MSIRLTHRMGALLMALTLLCAPAWAKASPRARKLTLSHKALTLYLGAGDTGQSAQLQASVAPSGADGALRWSSNKPDVVGVDGQGMVTALKLGKAVITCRTLDGSRLKRTVKVTVKPLVPTALTLSEPSMTLAPGEQKQLGWTLSPDNAYDQRVMFVSSQPAVARVSADGVVSGVKAGSATIAAWTLAGKLTAYCNVTVRPAGRDTPDVYYLAIGQAGYRADKALPDAREDVKRFKKTIDTASPGRPPTFASGRVLQDLTGSRLRAALQSLSAMGMTDDDITFFYYSGHGADSDSRRYRGALVGIDDAVVSLDELRGHLDKVPGTVVVMLDSCLSGQSIEPKNAGERDWIAYSQAVIDAFLPGSTASGARSKADQPLFENQPGKYMVLAASRPRQLSWSSGAGYGVFTYFLCEAAGITGERSLKDMGYMPGDSDRDGHLSLRETYDYAAPRILNWTREEGADPQNMMAWSANDAFPIFARIG